MIPNDSNQWLQSNRDDGAKGFAAISKPALKAPGVVGMADAPHPRWIRGDDYAVETEQAERNRTKDGARWSIRAGATRRGYRHSAP